MDVNAVQFLGKNVHLFIMENTAVKMISMTYNLFLRVAFNGIIPNAIHLGAVKTILKELSVVAVPKSIMNVHLSTMVFIVMQTVTSFLITFPLTAHNTNKSVIVMRQ